MDKEEQLTVPEKETLYEQDDISRQDMEAIRPDEVQITEEKQGAEQAQPVYGEQVPPMNAGYGNPSPQTPPMNANYGNPSPQVPPMNANYGNSSPQTPPMNAGYGNPSSQTPPMNANYGNPYPQVPPMNANYRDSTPQVPPMNPNYGNGVPPVNVNRGEQVPPMQPAYGNGVPPVNPNYRNGVPPVNNGMPSQMVQPPYGYMKRPETASYGMAIASMVLGIVSIVLCMWFYLALPCAIVGLVLGCVYRYKGGKNGMAIAGIICSSVGIAFAVIEICVYIMSFGAYYMFAY